MKAVTGPEGELCWEVAAGVDTGGLVRPGVSDAGGGGDGRGVEAVPVTPGVNRSGGGGRGTDVVAGAVGTGGAPERGGGLLRELPDGGVGVEDDCEAVGSTTGTLDVDPVVELGVAVEPVISSNAEFN